MLYYRAVTNPPYRNPAVGGSDPKLDAVYTYPSTAGFHPSLGGTLCVRAPNGTIRYVGGILESLASSIHPGLISNLRFRNASNQVFRALYVSTYESKSGDQSTPCPVRSDVWQHGLYLSYYLVNTSAGSQSGAGGGGSDERHTGTGIDFVSASGGGGGYAGVNDHGGQWATNGGPTLIDSGYVNAYMKGQNIGVYGGVGGGGAGGGGGGGAGGHRGGNSNQGGGGSAVYVWVAGGGIAYTYHWPVSGTWALYGGHGGGSNSNADGTRGGDGGSAARGDNGGGGGSTQDYNTNAGGGSGAYGSGLISGGSGAGAKTGKAGCCGCACCGCCCVCTCWDSGTESAGGGGAAGTAGSGGWGSVSVSYWYIGSGA